MKPLLVALLVVVTTHSAQAQDAYEGQIIRNVAIEGNVGVSRELIMANLRTRPGELLRRSLVDEDIRWLHNTYGILVSDVRREPGPVVTFVLKRILQYDWVAFEGNDNFKDDTLRDAGSVRAERGATPDQVVKARGLIRDYYLSKGYAFVQVEVRLEEAEDGTKGASILIFEGPEVNTKKYSIAGLTALRQSDMLDILRGSRGFWSWLVGKDFVRADVDRDVVILESFVRGEGYLDARVALGELDWSDDREDVRVTLVVEEGARYTVRSMQVEGNAEIPAAELLKDAALEVGAPLRRPDVARVIRAMRDMYGRRGYTDVEVYPEETYDLERPVVDIVWRIDEGVQKRVRDVIVRGNVGTRDSVVRRNLTIYPGDIVDTSELRYSEDALISLDYFSDLSGRPRVRVTTEPTPDPELVDVIVEVDDSSSGLFSFVVGAGSDNGIFAGISVDKRNFDISRASSSPGNFFEEFFSSGTAFHGGGQRLFMEVVPGTITTDINIVFQDPWLDNESEQPWGLTTELYDSRRIFSQFTERKTGFAVLFDRRLSRELSFSIGPRIERIIINDVDDTDGDVVTGEKTVFAQAEGTDQRRSFDAALRYNAVDSLYEPTTGHSQRLNLEGVGGPLGGANDVIRAWWSGEWFRPMGEDDAGNIRVFHPRASLGIVEPYGNTNDEDLPFYENLFVGGATGPFALRGFDFQGVGPHQEMRSTKLGPRLKDDNGSAVGGRMAAVASLEALFPLVTEYNPFRDREETIVKGVLFVDAGNLLPDVQLSDITDSYRLSTGAGVRVRLPALGGITLMLDYAFVLRDEDEDQLRPLSFELSRRF